MAEGTRHGELYRQSHVVLAPSRSTERWVEQFGRMIVEAQASGSVVVGYESGSIPEIGGDAAIRVREGDVEALAAAAALLLSDPDQFEARRRSGLALAQERTWSKIASKQVDLYRAALGAGPPTLLAGSPRTLRQRAIEEFGRPAEALGQARPFALPYLRRPSHLSRALGRAMDALAEHASRTLERGDRPDLPPARGYGLVDVQ